MYTANSLMLALICGGAVLGGCAPLQQAPLVYTSKQVVGIDISAPTTEANGVTVNVGFKNVDAAYVPVAVSKQESDGTTAHDIKELYATYGEGNGDSSSGGASKNREDDQRASAEKLAKAISAEQEAQKKLDKYNKELEAALASANNYVAEFNQRATYLKGLSVDDITQVEPAESQEQLALDKIEAENKLMEIAGKLDKDVNSYYEANKDAINNKGDLPQVTEDHISGEIRKFKQEAEDDLKLKQNSTKDAKDELAKVLYISQRDAFSVFGSFDSTTHGQAQDGGSVGINLGKMFSTGVAAQNLSKGMEKSALRSACLTAVAQLQNKNDDERKKLMALCADEK